MIPLSLDEIGALCPGRLDRAPKAELVTGLELDSRLIQPGDLFVAIRGGVDYVDEALARTHELRLPAQIAVRPNGSYTEVVHARFA